MKQTLAISAFAGMLARQSGYTTDFCERFVIEMFKTVTDALKESDRVIIKGLGSFTVDDSGNVGFTPDITFAADINSPFECFEPEPLDDDVTDDILSDDFDNPDADVENDNGIEPVNETVTEIRQEETDRPELQPEQEDSISQKEESEREEIPVHEDTSDIEVAEVSSELTEPALDSMPVSEELSVISTDEIETEATDTDSNEYAENDDYELPPRRRRHVWAFVCGVAVGTIIGASVTYLVLANGPQKESVEHINTDQQAVVQDLGKTQKSSDSHAVGQSDIATDTIVNPDLQAVDDAVIGIESSAPATETVVYDYVKTTLAQLSRKHYGRYEFWVYIYEENRDVISDPDLVEPDTRLRIPAPEKYGIDAHDNVSVNEALKKAREIAQER